jgi:hypothetical protein
MVDWGRGGRNRGYVKRWADTHLHEWDSTIERRAGGLDPTMAFSAQSLAVTNTSSLMALIVSTVYHFKTTGQVPASLAYAFTRIRVQLFFDAHADEIMVPQWKGEQQHMTRSNWQPPRSRHALHL